MNAAPGRMVPTTVSAFRGTRVPTASTRQVSTSMCTQIMMVQGNLCVTHWNGIDCSVVEM